MVQVTISNLVPATLPTDGWIVGYRLKGSAGAYINPIGSPFNALPIVFTTADPAGTLYEGFIRRDCGTLESAEFFWTAPCECSATYSVTADGSQCIKYDVIPASVTNPGYCLAPSTNGAYTNFESRIYSAGFSNATLLLPPATTGGFIYGRMTNTPQWANILANAVDGPMNREGVWIDSDCDGTKNPLDAGEQVTIAAIFNNAGGTRTIYVGVGADNSFKLKVNGSDIAEMPAGGNIPFKIWHIIPVTIVQGANYFNLEATGDGTVNDAMAMVIYDNTPAAIQAALSDASLNIIFKSSNLRGTTYDIATCPPTYSLDTSGGTGNYNCIKSVFKICNSADT